MFKRSLRDRSSLLQIISLNFLFKLLDEFANNKYIFTGQIYKIICNTLIENHSFINTRNLIFKNLEYILSNFESIPLDVFLIPLLKIISEKSKESYFFNTFDFEFFNVVINHPKLTMKLAIEILDVFTKLYFNDIIFASN